MEDFKFTVATHSSENFTAASLMKRYADSTAGASFERGDFGEAILVVDGARYKYDHWKIDGAYVTVFLKKVEPPKITRMNLT